MFRNQTTASASAAPGVADARDGTQAQRGASSDRAKQAGQPIIVLISISVLSWSASVLLLGCSGGLDYVIVFRFGDALFD